MASHPASPDSQGDSKKRKLPEIQVNVENSPDAGYERAEPARGAMVEASFLTTLLNKSCDPAMKSLARLQEIVETTFGDKPLADFSEDLDAIGVLLAERGMLYDALRFVDLRGRRKRAGMKKEDPRFTAFKRLVKSVEMETERCDAAGRADAAERAGLSLLRESDKVLDRELEKRLAPYGLRAGHLYEEGKKAAWVPFSWDSTVRGDWKIRALRLDLLTKEKAVVMCNPIFLVTLGGVGDRERAGQEMIKHTTDYLLRTIDEYRPKEWSESMRTVLEVLYESREPFAMGQLKDAQGEALAEVRLLGFYVSPNKNKRVTHVYFLKGDVSVVYEMNGALLKILLAEATRVSQSRKSARSA